MDSLSPEQWRKHREGLLNSLMPPTLPQFLSPHKLTVAGYVRTNGKPAKVRSECKRIQSYCDKHGFTLAQTFIDHRVPSATLIRPGLTALVDVLQLPDIAAAVVPSPHHLSWNPDLFEVIRQRICRTGARLIFLHGYRRDVGPFITTATGTLKLLNGSDQIDPNERGEP